VRKIRKVRYIVAGSWTIVIFLLGFLLGTAADIFKFSYLQSVVEKYNTDFESLQLQYYYLATIENSTQKSTCPIIQKILEKNLKVLQPVLEKLIEYEEGKENIDSAEYKILKRKYIIYNVRYLLLSEKAQKECGSDVVNIIYFYSGKECPHCGYQGSILTHLKNILKERLLVFPIDSDYRDEEPIVDILLLDYNVTKYPTLIINGVKYEGFLSEKELVNILCELYKEKPEIC
jgi:hypothetical protein